MQISEEMRRFLGAIARGSLKSALRTARPLGRPPLTTKSTDPFGHYPSEWKMLEQFIPGRISECRNRCCFLHERYVSPSSWRNEPLVPQLHALFANPPASAPKALRSLLDLPPDQVLFLDIETTGLGGTPLFLVGTLLLEGEDLVLRQFFARDLSEEAGVLEHTCDLMHRHSALVSFNGITFDVPYLVNRSVLHGLPLPTARLHVDLLHLARQRWRRHLPDCRLQTLEQFICQRRRVNDIPGAMMGRVYYDYLRTGDATRIRQVFQHNWLDLLTMAEIFCVLADGS